MYEIASVKQTVTTDQKLALPSLLPDTCVHIPPPPTHTHNPRSPHSLIHIYTHQPASLIHIEHRMRVGCACHTQTDRSQRTQTFVSLPPLVTVQTPPPIVPHT